MTSLNHNNNNSNNHYEEFPAPSSPSLPWFVEYWSTSLMNTPLVEQLLCSCNSSDSVLHSATEGSSSSAHNNRLRKVVASQMFDIDETNEQDQDQTMHSRHPIKSGKNKNHRPSVRSMSAYPSIRKSSILQDDEDDDDDDNSMNEWESPVVANNPFDNAILVDDDDDDDDDTREGVATSASCSTMNDYSSRMLYTCESFDQFIRGNSHSAKSGTTVRLQPRTVTARRGMDVDDDDAALMMRVPRLQHPSSPSNTTYTTVSLTQSYMHDDSFMDPDSSDGEEGDPTDQALFLERWNANTQQLFRGLANEEEEESERSTISNDPFQTPQSKRKRASVLEPPPPCKKNHQKDHSAYKYLIRMRPQNYRHSESVEETKWSDDDNESCCIDENSSNYSLPSHLQLHSNMTFHEAFLRKTAMAAMEESDPARSARESSPPIMPEF
ncbi:hypothetical protein IV203_007630 [Nitzschia inconspicua]|uniref:Uncharacterized protein n=1 Tax=Nitzschia inconspicua TaxID=303405 RepID=A0A9K3PCE2_9STRA|nr:hypothetical protein IV203_007630 [Nitzschia inconspicua]